MNPSAEAKQQPAEGYQESSIVRLPGDRDLTVIRTECKVVGKKTSDAEIIFRPQDSAFLLLRPEQVAALEVDAGEFDALSRRLEAARHTGDEKQLKVVKDAISLKLKPLVHGPRAQDLTEIIRLKSGTWSYVRADTIRNHWRRYPLYPDERTRSIFTDKEGNPRKDGQRLTGLIKAEWPKIKTRITADLYERTSEIYGKAGLSKLAVSDPELQQAFAGFDRVLDRLEKNYLNFHSDGTSPGFDVSGGAQLMRYYAGASFKSGLDLGKGRLSLAGEAKASFALFEGKVKSQVYFPNRDGHELKIANSEAAPGEGELAEMGRVPCDTRGIPEPTFALDNSFVRPGAIPGLKQLLAALFTRPGAWLQIVGHTDASGTASHNQALSARRARSVYAFLRNEAAVWVDLSFQEGWSPRIFKQILQQLGYYPVSEPPTDTGGSSFIAAVRAFQKTLPPLAPTGDTDPATRLSLFERYMRECENIGLRDVDFMQPPWIGRGETELEDTTAKPHEANRRVSFHLFKGDEPDGMHSDPNETISAGHLRADLELAVFAFAGASVMGSATIEFSVKNGRTYLRGGEMKKPATDGPKPVDTKFSALFGAKAGCSGKGRLQWRS